MDSYGGIVIDLGILAILGVSGLLAYSRGLAREMVTLVALALAAMATYYLFPLTVTSAQDFIESDEIAAGATIAVLFLGVLVAALVVGQSFARRINSSEAGSFDRWLGLLFGLVRGGLIVVLLFMLVSFALPGGEVNSAMQTARLLPLIENAAEWLLSLVPTQLQEDVVL